MIKVGRSGEKLVAVENDPSGATERLIAVRTLDEVPAPVSRELSDARVKIGRAYMALCSAVSAARCHGRYYPEIEAIRVSVRDSMKALYEWHSLNE